MQYQSYVFFMNLRMTDELLSSQVIAWDNMVKMVMDYSCMMYQLMTGQRARRFIFMV